jgi:predicted PurR-regulated permease PerM
MEQPEELFKEDENPDRLPLEVPISGPPAPPALVTRSPQWGETTKLVVGLSLVAISAFLTFRFMNILGPLLLAFVLAYLFYPIADFSQKKLHFSWRLAVTILYLIMLILMLGSLGIGGFAVFDQVQNLIGFLEEQLQNLPGIITNLSANPIRFGPFSFNLQLLDVNAVTDQILGVVRPFLSQAGTSVLSLATGTATLIGWMFFVLLVSYFILAESGGIPNRLMNFYIPGHEQDIQRLGEALDRIWNAFLRGQITIVLMTVLIYDILLGGLGVRFFFGLALLAGLARFVPYVGPLVAWTSYGLVAFFNGSTIFGLTPLGYAALVVGVAWFTDLIIDNVVSPRLMSNALRVHPAAVMVSALVAFNLLGVVGVVLAAPVLATVKLFGDYIIAKLFDQDPWVGMRTIPGPSPMPRVLPMIRTQYEIMRERITGRSRPKPRSDLK